MKTAEDLTTDIIQIAQWNGVFNGELRIHTEKLLAEFESEIRKDQDKITRHACADRISSMENAEIEGSYDNDFIDQHLAMSEIMNTKAIKEEL